MTDLLPIVLTPFAGALLAAWAGTAGRLWSAVVAGAVTLVALGLLAVPALSVMQGEVLIQQHQWVPAMGLSVALRLDGLSLLFVLMILCIGLLVILYARYYLSKRDPMGRFYAFLLLFNE